MDRGSEFHVILLTTYDGSPIRNVTASVDFSGKLSEEARLISRLISVTRLCRRDGLRECGLEVEVPTRLAPAPGGRQVL